MKKFNYMWEITIIVFLLIFSILIIEENQDIKEQINVVANRLQYREEELNEYKNENAILIEEKADLMEILQTIQLNDTVEFTQHSLYDVEEAFLAVVTSKTVEDIGFHYTVRDPFDTTQSLYIYSTLDVEVGSMMVLLELDSGNFVLLEIEN